MKSSCYAVANPTLFIAGKQIVPECRSTASRLLQFESWFATALSYLLCYLSLVRDLIYLTNS